MNNIINVSLPKDFDSKKYENKNIIIVGGGPSTNDVHWEDLDYDFIFSCNQYYMCDKLTDKKVEIVSLNGKSFHLQNESQDISHLNKLSIDESFIVIEPIHTVQFLNNPKFIKLKQKFADRIIYYDTRMQNRSGTAPRLALFSMFLKPKKVYMIGIDGSNTDCKAKHSFESGLMGFRDNWPYSETYKSYMDFSNHIFDISKKMNIEIFNLGEEHKDNMMSLHSKKNYPLTDKILMETKIS